MNIAKNLENQDVEINEKILVKERTFVCSMTRYGKN